MAAHPANIGHFQVLSEIGRGGMGIVYKVKDTKTGQVAALKMIPPEQLVRPDSALRFKREFRAMQRVEHPNVIRVFEAGTHDGCPFFTMELVEGKDIRRWLDGDAAIVPTGKDPPPAGLLSPEQRGRLNDPARVKKLADAIVQVAYALSEIHGHRIVHRDLKPDNILMSKAGVLKLMDFGIAKQISGAGEHSSGGLVVGTFKYLSPEQALGADIDGRADLYCLGIILYELLAGRHPFYSENSVGYAYHHARKPPPDIAKFNPEVHPGLKAICEKLIRKDPRERYATADDLIAAIRAAMEDFVEELSQRNRPVPRVKDLPFALKKDQLFSPALVGREREQATLLQSVESVLSGRGAVAAVTGPRGIGKTRLAREIAGGARARNIDFLWGVCRHEASVPYQPFIEILDSLVTQAAQLPTDELKRLIGDEGRILTRYVPALERIAADARPRPAPPLEPEGERLRFMSAVTAFLGRCAAAQPRVLLIDDIQHADELSLRLTRHLIGSLAKGDSTESAGHRYAPLAIVFTLDPNDENAEDARALMSRCAQDQGFTALKLGPLAVGDVREMLGSMIGGGEVASVLADFLHSETGGVPGLVEERVRAWADSGALRKQGAQWVFVRQPDGAPQGAPKSPDQDAAPPAVEVRAATRADIPIQLGGDAAELRVARLSDLARDVATRMAVAGERVPGSLLVTIALRREDELLDALDELIKRGVLQEDKSESYFKFTDTEDRDALIARLPIEKRQHLNLMVARAIEDDNKRQRRAQNPEELARHYLDGGEPERAIEQLMAAARLALAASATQSAARRVRDAQDLLQKELKERRHDTALAACDVELVLLRLDVLAAVNEHRDSVALAQRRLPRLRGVVDGRLVSEALLRLAGSERVLGDLDAALEHVGEVLAATERGGAHALRCRAKSLCGSIYEQRGEFDLSERYYADALELARAIGDELEEERARSAIAHRRLVAGDLPAARADYERLLAQAEQRGEKLRILGYVNSLGVIAHEEGRYDEAELAYRRMMELAKPAGDRRSVALGQLNVAVVRRDQGRPDDALSLCGKASRILLELNQAEGLSYVRIVEAQCLLDRAAGSDAKLALEKAEEAFDLAERAGAALKLAESSVARGQALARLGRVEEGLEDVQRALNVARNINANRIVLFGLTALVEVQHLNGDTAAAAAAYREALSRARATGFSRFLKRLDDLRRTYGFTD